MTERDFERRLRAYYRARVGETEGPAVLHVRVNAIPDVIPARSGLFGGQHRLVWLAAAALLAALVVGSAIAVGSGLLDLPWLPDSRPDITDHNDAATWVATGAMISDHSEGYALTRLADGRVLVVGGGGSRPLSAELFDPGTGQWSAAGDMLARNNPIAILLSDGRVLVAGGDDYDVAGDTYEVFSSAELYDPRTAVWTLTGSMIEARSGASATLLPDGRVLVAGGNVIVPNAGSRLDDVASAELYDPATGTWTAIAPMGEARSGHTATLLRDGRVLVVGGSKAELYNPGTGTWTPTADMINDREFHTATSLKDGTVLVAGGVTGGALGLLVAELYDPASGSWAATGNMVEARAWHTATLLLDGRVLLTGGGDGGYGGQPSAEVYDPETKSWSATDDMLSPRGWHEAIALTDGRVLVVGGFGSSGPGLNAEVFNPTSD
jgi:hypothetical protein